MSILPGHDEVTLADLANARILVRLGVPVFVSRLRSQEDPVPPEGWQRTEPDLSVVDRWKPGQALCAVTGVVYDVIDIDPRHGGWASFRELSESLGDSGPEVYWEYDTASGGRHFWIACLGIGSHNGIMPGIDLKGGYPDGSGRGFVFIPPTARLGKLVAV